MCENTGGRERGKGNYVIISKINEMMYINVNAHRRQEISKVTWLLVPSEGEWNVGGRKGQRRIKEQEGLNAVGNGEKHRKKSLRVANTKAL